MENVALGTFRQNSHQISHQPWQRKIHSALLQRGWIDRQVKSEWSTFSEQRFRAIDTEQHWGWGWHLDLRDSPAASVEDRWLSLISASVSQFTVQSRIITQSSELLFLVVLDFPFLRKALFFWACFVCFFSKDFRASPTRTNPCCFCGVFLIFPKRLGREDQRKMGIFRRGPQKGVSVICSDVLKKRRSKSEQIGVFKSDKGTKT